MNMHRGASISCALALLLPLFAGSASAQDLHSQFSLYNLSSNQTIRLENWPDTPTQTGHWNFSDNRVLSPSMYELKFSTDATGAGATGVGGATELRFDLNLSAPVNTDGSSRGNLPVEFGGPPIDFLGPFVEAVTIETPTSMSHSYQSSEMSSTFARGLLMARQWGSLGGHDAPGSFVYWRFQVNTPTTFALTGTVDHTTTPDAPPGSSQINPHMPTDANYNDGNPLLMFTLSNLDPANGWFDPPTADAYDFHAREGLFTAIADFPAGFDDAFTVTINGTNYGPFSPGQSMSFASFPGGGISDFTVSGISPDADRRYPLSFPIKLNFNTPDPEFTMTPMPEPSSLALVGMLAAALLRRRRRN